MKKTCECGTKIGKYDTNCRNCGKKIEKKSGVKSMIFYSIAVLFAVLGLLLIVALILDALSGSSDSEFNIFKIFRHGYF